MLWHSSRPEILRKNQIEQHRNRTMRAEQIEPRLPVAGHRTA